MSSMDASSIWYNSSHSTDRVQARARDSHASSGIDVACPTTQSVLAIASPYESPEDSCSSSSTGTSSFCCNQQYSVYALTDSSGNVSERYAYSAYGEPTVLNEGSDLMVARFLKGRVRVYLAVMQLHSVRMLAAFGQLRLTE